MLELGKAGQRLKDWLSQDFKLKLIVLLGLAGMALILFSQFAGDKKPEPKTDAATVEITSAGYASEMEVKLTELIAGMEGVGRTTVMVTLENAGETVYAQEEKRNSDRQQEGGTAEVSGKVYQKENVEQKYIIVEGQTGREALVRTRLEPKIQGVVVVCEGAGDPRVERDVIHVVTTALNIPTTRVCVVKISENQ